MELRSQQRCPGCLRQQSLAALIEQASKENHVGSTAHPCSEVMRKSVSGWSSWSNRKLLQAISPDHPKSSTTSHRHLQMLWSDHRSKLLLEAERGRGVRDSKPRLGNCMPSTCGARERRHLTKDTQKRRPVVPGRRDRSRTFECLLRGTDGYVSRDFGMTRGLSAHPDSPQGRKGVVPNYPYLSGGL
jgi:hypothetical protein